MPSNPSHFSLVDCIRPNVLALTPYRCARDDYPNAPGMVLLDANENSLGHSLPEATREDDEQDLHRYPSPSHVPVKERLCRLRGVPSVDHVFLGVGSDEVIDLLFRIACVPGRDRALVTPPTYGMYKVCAQVNDVGVVTVPLDDHFLPDVDEINRVVTESYATPNPIKLVFLCSPGNPTGTVVPLDAVRKVLSNPSFKGLVVLDEAYIDFGPEESSGVQLLVDEGWDNLVVMQTLSKGFGLAAIRLGVAFASRQVVQVLNNIKAPYNVSTPTASLALRALSDDGLATFRTKVATIVKSRESLRERLLKLDGVMGIIGANHANFLMCQIGRNGKPDNKLAHDIYLRMASEDHVVVRFRGTERGCDGCLRVTVGTEVESDRVVERMRALLKEL